MRHFCFVQVRVDTTDRRVLDVRASVAAEHRTGDTLLDRKGRVRIVHDKSKIMNRNVEAPERWKNLQKRLASHGIGVSSMADLIRNTVVVLIDPNNRKPVEVSIITQHKKRMPDGKVRTVNGTRYDDFIDLPEMHTTKYVKSFYQKRSKDPEVRESVSTQLRQAVSRTETVTAAHAHASSFESKSKRDLKKETTNFVRRQRAIDREVSYIFECIEKRIETIGFDQDEKKEIKKRAVVMFVGDTKFRTYGPTFDILDKMAQRCSLITSENQDQGRLWFFSFWTEYRNSKSCWFCRVKKRVPSNTSESDRSVLYRDMNVVQCLSNKSRSLDPAYEKRAHVWDYVRCEKHGSAPMHRDFKANRVMFSDIKSVADYGARASYLEPYTGEYYSPQDIGELKEKFDKLDKKRTKRRVLRSNILYLDTPDSAEKIALEYNQCSKFIDVFCGDTYLMVPNIVSLEYSTCDENVFGRTKKWYVVYLNASYRFRLWQAEFDRLREWCEKRNMLLGKENAHLFLKTTKIFDETFSITCVSSERAFRCVDTKGIKLQIRLYPNGTIFALYGEQDIRDGFCKIVKMTRCASSFVFHDVARVVIGDASFTLQRSSADSLVRFCVSIFHREGLPNVPRQIDVDWGDGSSLVLYPKNRRKNHKMRRRTRTRRTRTTTTTESSYLEQQLRTEVNAKFNNTTKIVNGERSNSLKYDAVIRRSRDAEDVSEVLERNRNTSSDFRIDYSASGTSEVRLKQSIKKKSHSQHFFLLNRYQTMEVTRAHLRYVSKKAQKKNCLLLGKNLLVHFRLDCMFLQSLRVTSLCQIKCRSQSLNYPMLGFLAYRLRHRKDW